MSIYSSVVNDTESTIQKGHTVVVQSFWIASALSIFVLSKTLKYNYHGFRYIKFVVLSIVVVSILF